MHIEIQIKIEIKRWIPFLLHACMYCILKMQAGIWNNTDAWSQLQHRRAVNTSGKKGEAYHGLDYIIKLLASLAFAPRFAMQLVPQFIDVHLHLFWNILYTIFLAASMTATRFKRTQFSAAIWRWEPGIFFPPRRGEAAATGTGVAHMPKSSSNTNPPLSFGGKGWSGFT